MVIPVAYPTLNRYLRRLSDGHSVALPMVWSLFSQKKFTTNEDILSLKRRFTFNWRLLRCRLTDGYLGVG